MSNSTGPSTTVFHSPSVALCTWISSAVMSMAVIAGFGRSVTRTSSVPMGPAPDSGVGVGVAVGLGRVGGWGVGGGGGGGGWWPWVWEWSPHHRTLPAEWLPPAEALSPADVEIV